jgi:carbon storage regulator CsrA
MLVLSRNQNEEIEIDASHMPVGTDGKIRIVVVEAKHGRTRLGFDAHRSITVNRREVADRITNDPPTRRAG